MSLTQKVLATIFFSFCLIWFAAQHIGIQVNISESLPQKVFLVLKNTLPVKDDYVAFYATENGVYPRDTAFVKRVAGVSGDAVTSNDRVFSVNGKEIGKAKELSNAGMLLEPGYTGVLSDGQYFVYTTHQDSFDSRYKNIGWIEQDAIIGRAIPLL